MSDDNETRVRHRFVGLYVLLLGLLGANMAGTLLWIMFLFVLTFADFLTR